MFKAKELQNGTRSKTKSATATTCFGIFALTQTLPTKQSNQFDNALDRLKYDRLFGQAILGITLIVNTMEPTKIFCKECGKGKLQVDTESGEVYCNKCGYVTKKQEYEERSLTIEEQDRSAPMKISGQSTVIGGQSDINQKIGAKFKKMKSRMIQMGLWDSQISKSKESQRLDRNNRKFEDLVLLLIPTIGERFLSHFSRNVVN